MIGHIFRLARVGIVLGRHGVEFVPKRSDEPLPVRAGRLLITPFTWFSRTDSGSRGDRLSKAMQTLGPTYIKLGQFLATRRDVIPEKLADDLSQLQDRMPSFSQEIARQTVKDELDRPVETLFADFSQPIAAASIAQVHKAHVRDASGGLRSVAVKILRPGIERRFRRDLDSFFFAARWLERLSEASRRLRPVAVVETLEESMEIEMDLRLEAAAISEMSDNTVADPGFRVPRVDWNRTSRRVLTMEWVDGIPAYDKQALIDAGHDLHRLGETVIQSFLRHALRDGFFHADMHQGNLFVDAQGNLVAVDFGIMGRCGENERRFLAEILYGFITRDYRRIAEVHFEAGYVPEHQSVELFAQAMRAVGEPVMDRPAADISMAQLLGQLFQYTEVFEMKTRTELIMLQKTMVIVEGVARYLDSNINMYSAAEPIVKEWMEAKLGVEGVVGDAQANARKMGTFVSELPSMLLRAERTAGALSDMAKGGLRLDDATIEKISRAQSRRDNWLKVGVWVGAIALTTLAAFHILG